MISKSKQSLRVFTLFAIIFLILIFPTNSFAARPDFSASSTDVISIKVSVTDAYYTDLDNDGLSDDVIAYTSVDLSGSTRYNFDYYITLTLPSGKNYTYAYTFNTVYTTLNIRNYFWNHATECGDYTITVQAILWTGGISYTNHAYTFDPPGGSDGGDPTFDLTVD